MNEFIDIIEKSGYPVAMNEPQCLIWKADHKTCQDCPSDLGCGKATKLRMLHSIPLFYVPKSFEDFQKMRYRIDELTNMILEAKTVNDLQKIPTI